MKKVEKRALMCLLLGLVLLAGLCYFIYEDWDQGDKWAVYKGNRDVFADGSLAKGALYDRDGALLMRNTSDGMVFNDDSNIRSACLHITGDKDNNIATGANRIFLDRLIGFDFVNGIYSLNNDGEDVAVTLDADICATAYQALAGRKGTVGVYNYKTGELICMVSSPTYDPDDPPYEIPEGSYINRFISSTFAPGSTFKLVTAAASIETQDDAYSFEVDCTGSIDYGHNDEVTDLDAHGTVSLKKALEVSCNCYFARLSEKLGSKTLKKYVQKTRLDKSYDIDGMVTKAGTFDYPDTPVNLAWTGIGQWHDMVNPCGMMVYMGAIANGGTAVMPSIIKPSNIVSEKIDAAASALKTEDMIEEETSESLTNMMRNNVEEHYGGENAFPGLELCAKSGTAEVEGQDNPNAWFVGFLNDEDNPYAFVVMVENSGYGSDVGGAVANTVLQDLVHKD